MLTTTQAAEALGIKRTTVLKLIARKQLKAEAYPWDNRWYIRQREVDRYNRNRKKPGRPKN